jgi:hypothetical protein
LQGDGCGMNAICWRETKVKRIHLILWINNNSAIININIVSTKLRYIIKVDIITNKLTGKNLTDVEDVG